MFLVCGEALIDFLPGGKGQPAGSLLNVAIGLARLGHRAALVTGLSRDAWGEVLLAKLREEGVDMSLAPRTDNPTIRAEVSVDASGHPTYVFHHKDDGADFQVTTDWLGTPLPDAVSAIHLGGFPLAVDPSKGTFAALVRREAARRFVSIDPNIRPGLMGDLAAYRAHFEGLLPHLALVKASMEDIGLLYPDVDAMTVARRWRTLGAGTVVITDGAKGAFSLNDHGVTLVRTEPVEVVDAVGAGDSFISALLAFLAERALLERGRLAGATPDLLREGLGFANRAAGINCGRIGSDPPRRADL
ncbi:MAG: carbohydrate kinase family protein, partial [Beijerinckiaceae bacterium]